MLGDSDTEQLEHSSDVVAAGVPEVCTRDDTGRPVAGVVALDRLDQQVGEVVGVGVRVLGEDIRVASCVSFTHASVLGTEMAGVGVSAVDVAPDARSLHLSRRPNGRQVRTGAAISVTDAATGSQWARPSSTGCPGTPSYDARRAAPASASVASRAITSDVMSGRSTSISTVASWSVSSSAASPARSEAEIQSAQSAATTERTSAWSGTSPAASSARAPSTTRHRRSRHRAERRPWRAASPRPAPWGGPCGRRHRRRAAVPRWSPAHHAPTAANSR